jgi:hypothetical protein
MIAASRRAGFSSGRSGSSRESRIEFDKVNDHIHRVIHAIAPGDSERFTGSRG